MLGVQPSGVITSESYFHCIANGAMSQLIILKIDAQKLTSLNLVLRATNMTPVKPQISKFQAEKSC
jgi:hypothetical protein